MSTLDDLNCIGLIKTKLFFKLDLIFEIVCFTLSLKAQILKMLCGNAEFILCPGTTKNFVTNK